MTDNERRVRVFLGETELLEDESPVVPIAQRQRWWRMKRRMRAKRAALREWLRWHANELLEVVVGVVVVAAVVLWWMR